VYALEAESDGLNPAANRFAVSANMEGPGIKFHDGTPLTADVTKKNFDAIKASALTRFAMAPLSRVEVADDLTARVFMSSPWVVFPAVLTTQVGFVASAATAGDPTAGRHPVGTGPFVFDEWQPDARLRMKKNPDYWRKGCGTSTPSSSGPRPTRTAISTASPPRTST